MKKALTLLLGCLICLSIKAQTYHTLNIREPEYSTIGSDQGIEVISIIPVSDGSFTVKMFNANYSESGMITNYSFQWYLSYKGKRISDYFNNTIRCRTDASYSKYAWPGIVPKGNEKYVTVQFGKEKPKKDRRDDD